ncbi:MAG: cyclic-di-AMP-binding protein CbpB [Lactobacillus sp.]
MFSPTIQRLIEDKAGAFLIPASRIACVQVDNPLYHAFLVLTKDHYAKIPVLDHQQRVVGLLSLSMITDKMLKNTEISTEPLNQLTVQTVMQTHFATINFAQTTLEAQLHLLINNAFLPVVNDRGVFQGLLTRREWIKTFNYIAHTFDNKYQVKEMTSNLE